MYKNVVIPQVNTDDFDICESCVKGKLTYKLFNKHWHSSDLFEIVYPDICELFRTTTHR